jgi:hypothetical protein
MKRVLLIFLFCLVIVAAQGSWATVWTQFNSMSTGTVMGSMGGVTVIYTSTDLNGNTQINNLGTNYWLCGATYCPVYYYAPLGITPPDTVDMVSLNGNNVIHTITFSSPVTNPFMAIISLGQPSTFFTTYYFDQPFTILTSGAGWWVPSFTGSLNYLGTNGLQGVEGNGLIEFPGTITQISWTGDDANAEYWNGFNVGTTPEPGTLALLGTSLLGAAGMLRRRLGK